MLYQLILSRIHQEAGRLPHLAQVNFGQAMMHICSQPTQIPLLSPLGRSFCLIAPLNTRATLSLNQQKTICRPGQIVGLGKANYQDWLSASLPEANQHVPKLLTITGDETLSRHLTESDEKGSIPFGQFVQTLDLPGLMDLYLILYEFNERQVGCTHALKCAAGHLTLQVFRKSTQKPLCGLKMSGLKREKQKSGIDPMMRYIEDHLAENVTVRQMADQRGLSESQFIRCFVRQTGITPYRMLTLMRLQKAMQLLSEDQVPIKTVCVRCGIRSPSRFASLFKREIGLLPSQYRKLMKRFACMNAESQVK